MLKRDSAANLKKNVLVIGVVHYKKGVLDVKKYPTYYRDQARMEVRYLMSY